MVRAMSRSWWRALPLSALLLAGCAGSMEPVAPCCYSGDYSMSRLADVRLALAGGRTVAFGEQFPDYAPYPGLLAPLLPFREAPVTEADDPRTAETLRRHDANGDGIIEEPELSRLMVHEAATGLGHQVDHLQASPRVQALVLSAADTGGLMRWLKRRLPGMTADAQALFRDLERIGQDLRLRGSEGEGNQADADFDE